MILSKSDFDIQRREAFIIKDTVSARKKAVVEKFLTKCRHRFRNHIDESNIQVELNCGFTKGDDFQGFSAMKQCQTSDFSIESMVANEQVNGVGEVMVIDFIKQGD